MKTCKHCKKRVSGPHHCEVAGSFVSALGDFLEDAIGNVVDALTSFGDSDSGSDFGGFD